MTPLAALVVFGIAAPAGSPDAAPPLGVETRAPVDVGPSAAPAPRAPNIVVPAVHGIALMTVMRVTETVIWPDPFARPEQFAARYEEAFTRPPKFDAAQPFMRWDGDPLAVNVVGHALFGSELYLRARQCRLGWAGALAFTAGTSAVWEYGFEANGARPSALDLVYTPLAGIALGEARYLLHRAAGAMSSTGARAVVRSVLDPLGELERAAGSGC